MNAKKAKTHTPPQATAEVTAALRRVSLSTAGESPRKCGLEYICKLLDGARGYAEYAAARILPNVADVKLNPAPTLAALCATPQEWKTKPAVTLSELGELIFGQLQKEAALKPDVELLHLRRVYHGDSRLERFAFYWFVFLFGWDNCGGCFAFMRKKIALAQTLGKLGAADKLDEAFRQLMPAFTLTGDLDKDVGRFAAEITPDVFHVAFRNALKLDAEATAEINGEEKSTANGGADSVDDRLKRIEARQIALLDGQSEQNKFSIALGQTLDEIKRDMRPRRTLRGAYKVTQEDAAHRLGRTVRTIKNWEAGRNTPEGYSRDTRLTLEIFTAWATDWEAGQKSKLNTKKAMRYADEHGYTFGASQR